MSCRRTKCRIVFGGRHGSRGLLISLAMVAVGAPAVPQTREMAATTDMPRSDILTLRIVAFNVRYGSMATPEEIAHILGRFSPDIVLLSEVPAGDWVTRLAEQLSLGSHVISNMSSADQKDKHVSILSRYPLNDSCEFPVTSKGAWNPGTVVRARAMVGDIPLILYSVHIAHSRDDGHAGMLSESILAKDKSSNIVIGGDFNELPTGSGLSHIEAQGFRLVWDIAGTNVRDMSSRIDKSTDGLIDHILVKTRGTVEKAKAGVVALRKPLSDHRPVWAAIRLAPKVPQDRDDTDENFCPS